MSFLIYLLLYLLSGCLGVSIVRFFYWVYGCPWEEDKKCFLWTGLTLGWFALIGFSLWIGCILINELLRKVHLNIF
jgi:hypothetical protein